VPFAWRSPHSVVEKRWIGAIGPNISSFRDVRMVRHVGQKCRLEKSPCEGVGAPVTILAPSWRHHRRRRSSRSERFCDQRAEIDALFEPGPTRIRLHGGGNFCVNSCADAVFCT